MNPRGFLDAAPVIWDRVLGGLAVSGWPLDPSLDDLPCNPIVSSTQVLTEIVLGGMRHRQVVWATATGDLETVLCHRDEFEAPRAWCGVSILRESGSRLDRPAAQSLGVALVAALAERVTACGAAVSPAPFPADGVVSVDTVLWLREVDENPDNVSPPYKSKRWSRISAGVAVAIVAPRPLGRVR